MFEGLRFNHWKTCCDDKGIVTLTLDRADSRVNAISRAILDELDQILERLAIEKPVGVVLHSAKTSGFSVGADIREFADYAQRDTIMENIQHGQGVYNSLAHLPCPTVAAIHGSCLGGGTELILACRQRIAVDDDKTRIALPEVMLGMHPGWGGSARLPRLIGATDALPVMLTGRSLSARRARAIGVVDRLVCADRLLVEAKALLHCPVSRPFKRRIKTWATQTWIARQIMAPIILRQTALKVRKAHYPAPFALIDIWKRGGKNMQRCLKLEAQSLEKLVKTATAQNLIRIFFLQERLKGTGNAVEHGIKHVHVVGAGVMGGDIAGWAALKGFEVTLQDRDNTYIQPALERAQKLYEKKLKTAEKTGVAMRRLHPDVGGEGIKQADLVIEAIHENAVAKETLYAAIEPTFPTGGIILATNTSCIALNELLKKLTAPQHFIGLHFFNPVAHMPLVEVVRHDLLDPAIEKRAMAFCKAIGKLPLAVKGSPGFLVNRVLMPYLLEAMHLYNEGVPGPVLDKVAKEFGMPMGPIELADTVGLDVCASVGKELAPFLKLDLPAGLEDKLTSGKRGKKDGQGLYQWQEGIPQKPEVDPDYIASDDLKDRMILPMVNEAVACLADGVVDDADLLDAGVIFGTGFAPFRGGPLQYVRSEGVDYIKARLLKLATQYGKRFMPGSGWDLPTLRQSHVDMN